MAVKIRCFECVAEIDPDSRFCDKCGAPVPEAAGGTERTRGYRRRQWMRSAAIAGAIGGVSGAIGVLTRDGQAPTPPRLAAAREVVDTLSQALQLDTGAPAMQVPASFEVLEGDALGELVSRVAPQLGELERIRARVSPAGWKNGIAVVAAGDDRGFDAGTTIAETVAQVRQASIEGLASLPTEPEVTLTRGPNDRYVDLRLTMAGSKFFGATTRFWATPDGLVHEAGCLCIAGPCAQMIDTCELPPVGTDAIAVDAPLAEPAP